MAFWLPIPDRLDEGETRVLRMGVFATTVIAFFLAEIGNKTQVATVALAAQYQTSTTAVAGTTLGTLIANVPAVVRGTDWRVEFRRD